MVGSTETRSPSWGTLASLQEVSTCTLYSASIMCHLVENSEYVHVYSSCSAQKGQHEPYKGECCSCLGTATNLLDIYVINHNHCHSYSVSGRFEGRGKIAMTFEPMQRKLPELKLTRVQRSQIGIIARARREWPGNEATAPAASGISPPCRRGPSPPSPSCTSSTSCPCPQCSPHPKRLLTQASSSYMTSKPFIRHWGNRAPLLFREQRRRRVWMPSKNMFLK